MTTTPRIFNQLKPTNTLQSTLLYSVPAGQQAQLTIIVCNQTAALENFRIAVVQAPQNPGNQPDISNYIAYDTPLIGNGIFAISGIGLNSSDQIWIRSQLGNVSFTATGIQFS